jgi:hypothetical protein
MILSFTLQKYWRSLLLVCKDWSSQSLLDCLRTLSSPLCMLNDLTARVRMANLVQTLTLDLNHFQDEHLAILQNFTVLRTLSLHNDATEIAISAIGTVLTKLQSLTLDNCFVNDDMDPILPRLTALTELHLNHGHFYKANETFVISLPTFTNLTSLSLDHVDVDHANLNVMNAISTLPLQSLSIQNMGYGAAVVGSEHFLPITALTDLTDLDVSYNHGVDPLVLQSLCSSLTRLCTLRLAGCRQIDDMAMQHLLHLRCSLTSLNVSECEITDAGLCFVAQLKKLETIILDNCEAVSDIGLEYLASHPTLRLISADGTMITKAALQSWRIS